MKKKLTQRHVSRIILFTAIVSAGIFILAMILNAAMDNSHYDKIWKHRDQREKAYTDIINHLEYNGLDDDARSMMESFSSVYTEFANFIITDADFNILYSLNKGYIDENSSKFYVLLDANANNNMALICDADGNVLSSHFLEGNSMDALRRLTETYPSKSNAARVPTMNVGDSSDGIAYQRGGVYVTYMDGSYYNDYYNESVSTLRYNAIKSKNLYVSFLFGNDDPRWTGDIYDSSRNSGYRLRQNVLMTLIVLSLISYWLALPVYVFLDARRHDNHPALWGVLALFTNVVGLIVYLAVRPDRIYCTVCHEPLDEKHAYCPLCGVRNQAKCANCGNLVKSDWTHCPSCGANLGTESVPTEPATAESVSESES